MKGNFLVNIRHPEGYSGLPGSCWRLEGENGLRGATGCDDPKEVLDDAATGKYLLPSLVWRERWGEGAQRGDTA